MSKIKLPHASGNSMSIAAPATNPSGDLELKLPATIGTANQYLKNSSTAGTLEFGTITTGKIIQVIQHLDTADYSTTAQSYTQGPQTPTFELANSSNKVLVQCNWMAFMDARSGGTISVRNAIYRGSIASGTLINTGSQPIQYFGNTVNYEYYMGHSFLQWLDTPGGNTTYSLAIRNAASNSNAAKIRGTQQTTSITLMEVAV